MTGRSGPPFRADHVGSLLRPPSLLDLRSRASRGEVSPQALRAREDECIRDVVALQESLGLQSITDGEYRRESFHGDFMRRIEGVEFKLMPAGASPSGGPFVAFVTGRMRRPAVGLEVENFRYLSSLTSRTAKQTMPSPTMTHFRGGRGAIDLAAYPDMDDFFADLARLYREEIAALGEAGCRYLQLDDTNLAYLCDEEIRARLRERGEDVERLPQDYARLINESIRGRPDEMAVCVHLCRGNARSRWFAQGGYEPVAEILFDELAVDGFFLEYDDERSGDFAPLRFVPKSKAVVLGLVTSKRGELEEADTVMRRVEEAARYLPLEQLCLSPQCGFASASEGNLLTEDDEKRKLALIVELAERIWG
ncbi:MAG TPA: 5-methyltetrahydropteroyltriglutamate--homocysteine S-methyltransferase [Gammaproteobacteria bacterium]|nr:5-methyltetrahydropteroyltriglutamate--homocysteine S-methyltransferase [Gammaproteobacteria bacterium]